MSLRLSAYALQGALWAALGGAIFTLAGDSLLFIVLWLLLGILLCVHATDAHFDEEDGKRPNKVSEKLDTASVSGSKKLARKPSFQRPATECDVPEKDDDDIEILLHNVNAFAV